MQYNTKLQKHDLANLSAAISSPKRFKNVLDGCLATPKHQNEWCSKL